MTLDDVADLRAAWARSPPAHVAVRRLENVVRGIVGADPAPDGSAIPASSSSSAGGWTPERPPQLPPVDEASVRAFVAQVTGGRS